MSVAETSLDSYIQNIESGLIGERQSMVLEKIRLLPKLTAMEYSKFCFCKSDPNFIRPRITELKDMGLIRCVGKRKCQVTNRNAMVWEVCQ